MFFSANSELIGFSFQAAAELWIDAVQVLSQAGYAGRARGAVEQRHGPESLPHTFRRHALHGAAARLRALLLGGARRDEHVNGACKGPLISMRMNITQISISCNPPSSK